MFTKYLLFNLPNTYSIFVGWFFQKPDIRVPFFSEFSVGLRVWWIEEDPPSNNFE